MLGPDGFRLAPPLSAATRGGVETAVEAAVAHIKRLKGDEGRGNKDAAVVAAVAEMKRGREVLSADDQNLALTLALTLTLSLSLSLTLPLTITITITLTTTLTDFGACIAG